MGSPIPAMDQMWQNMLANLHAMPVTVMAAAAVAFVLGTMFLFFGWYSYRVGLAIGGFMIGAFVGVVLATVFNMMPLVTAVLVGIAGAIVAVSSEKAGAFSIGAICALIVLNGFRSSFSSLQSFQVVQLIAAIAAGIVVVMFWRALVIMTMAIVGAFFVLLGIFILVAWMWQDKGVQWFAAHSGWCTIGLIALAFFGSYVQIESQRHAPPPAEAEA